MHGWKQKKKTRDWGCCAARLLGSTGRLGILSHKHIIYDSYDSVYCVTCLDLRSFISFLQGPAHKLRKRRMHRMHRMHWICKRFWSPKISKHLQTPSASNGHKLRSYAAMAATQLCSYAAWPLGLEIRTTTNSYPGGLRNMPVFTGTSQNAQNSLKNSCVFCFVFCFRFLLFVFLLFLPFPPSPSLSSPDPRAFFAELELERSNASVHFAMHRKKSGRNSRKPTIGVVTCCDILWHQKRVLISLVSKSVPKCARKSFDVSQQFQVAAKSLILLTGARMDRKNMNPSSIP